jgi:hypothetical protein
VNTGTKLAAFGAGLAVTFVGALGVGAAVGPIDDDDDGAHAVHDGDTSSDADQLPAGLLVNDQGYTLDLLSPAVASGAPAQLALRILDPSGQPVVAFDDLHERQLHLIVVDRQLATFQHVHPVMDAEGVWTVDIELDTAGVYRVFTDIQPSALGEQLTLGADLVVPGDIEVLPDLAASATSAVDGYRVTLDGTIRAGGTSDVTLTVARDGDPVTDLDPYLGAYGHLVAVRDGDLAYLHVHPNGEPGDGATEPGPEIGFGVSAPGPGTYRLFLDFSHGGVVRTADFTVVVSPEDSHDDRPTDGADVHDDGTGGPVDTDSEHEEGH